MATDDLSILQELPISEGLSKLEELLAQTDRAFLLGAGASKCAGLPLTAELTDKVLDSDKLDDYTKEILAAIKDLFTGAADSNIEDFPSELIDYLAIVERRVAHNAKKATVALAGKEYGKSDLQKASVQIKRGIAEAIEKPVSIEMHRKFVRTLHVPQRPGASSGVRPIDYLVLNYDTILEDALSLERITYADGIDGGVTGWWNPSTFHATNLSAHRRWVESPVQGEPATELIVMNRWVPVLQ